jgi:hypothetical protein
MEPAQALVFDNVPFKLDTFRADIRDIEPLIPFFSTQTQLTTCQLPYISTPTYPQHRLEVMFPDLRHIYVGSEMLWHCQNLPVKSIKVEDSAGIDIGRVLTQLHTYRHVWAHSLTNLSLLGTSPDLWDKSYMHLATLLVQIHNCAPLLEVLEAGNYCTVQWNEVLYSGRICC